MAILPDFLSHYYEASRGPFRSLSTLPPPAAEAVLQDLRTRGEGFASRRAADYLAIRGDLEARIRALFVAKGGQPQRATPHYMILGTCAWLVSWYRQGCELRLSLAAFRPETLSFTYGDSFPAMRYPDGKPYRGQVYRLDELPALVDCYGLPQDWNPDGQGGPERYIEAQVWDDTGLADFLDWTK